MPDEPTEEQLDRIIESFEENNFRLSDMEKGLEDGE